MAESGGSEYNMPLIGPGMARADKLIPNNYK